jgi:glutaredoxin
MIKRPDEHDNVRDASVTDASASGSHNTADDGTSADEEEAEHSEMGSDELRRAIDLSISRQVSDRIESDSESSPDAKRLKPTFTHISGGFYGIMGKSKLGQVLSQAGLKRLKDVPYIVLVKPGCPYCARAVEILELAGYKQASDAEVVKIVKGEVDPPRDTFLSINAMADLASHERFLLQRTFKHNTWPMVFHFNDFIGGAAELEAHLLPLHHHQQQQQEDHHQHVNSIQQDLLSEKTGSMTGGWDSWGVVAELNRAYVRYSANIGEGSVLAHSLVGAAQTLARSSSRPLTAAAALDIAALV